MFPFRKARAAVALALVAALAACSASKSASPAGPSEPLTARLRASDVLTGAAVPGATVTGAGLSAGTTDSGGAVTVTSTTNSTFAIGISATSYITRNTLLKVPGNDAGVSLIPNSLDLPAFDQMFRADALRRWTTVPGLRVVSHVLDSSDAGYTATTEALTPAEIASITSDLAYGLPLLTGSVLTSFAGSATLTVTPGAAVAPLVDGQITFARCRGVTAQRGSAGYAQIQYIDATNVVTGAMICIDRDFELSGSTVGRAVRLHELGHTLGALHVTVKANVLMNPQISVTDITPWDRDAARIAYQRPPGNRSPDQDPASYSTNRLVTRLVIADGCRAGR